MRRKAGPWTWRDWLLVGSAAGAISTTISLVWRLVVGGHEMARTYIVGTMAPVTRQVAEEVVTLSPTTSSDSTAILVLAGESAVPVEAYLLAGALACIVIFMVVIIAERVRVAGDVERFRARLSGRPR
jgi:hypothetical protein